MAKILVFPTVPFDGAEPQRFTLAARPRVNPNEYALADVARRLGLLDFSIRTIVDKLRTLARHDGMPLPRTPRIVKSEPLRGPLVIYSRSRWNAGEFDAWLENRGPAPTTPAPLAPALIHDMAQRAVALGAGR